jgi:hypothetical protein
MSLVISSKRTCHVVYVAYWHVSALLRAGTSQHGTRILYRGSVEWALNYADPSNPIGIPKSHHEGRLTGKDTIGNKAITIDRNLFCCAHFYVLQQMSIVSKYLDEQKEELLRDIPGCNESLAGSRIGFLN